MRQLKFLNLFLLAFLLASTVCTTGWAQEDNLGLSNKNEYQTTVKEPNEWVRPELRPLNTNVVTSNEQAFSDKSNFGIFLFSMGGLNHSNLKGDATAIDFWDNYISFNYKFSDGFAIAVRPAFNFTTGGVNKYGDEVASALEWRDLSFVTAFGEVLEGMLPASMSFKTQFRFYLPTSDYSKNSGLIIRMRWQNDLKYYFMRYNYVRFFFKTSYHFQRNTAYLDSSNPKFPPSVRTTPAWDIDWGGEVTWSLNKKFALKTGFEAEEDWSNSSPANNLDAYRKSVVRWDILAAEFRPSRSFSVSLSGNLSRDLIRADKETEYGITLITGAVLY